MKKYIKTIRKLTLLACMLGAATAHAQGKLQVATKKIERTIGAPAVRTMYISAEKADIEIVTWDNADISVTIELSARHPDRSTATQDLSKLQYIADRNGRDYFLRNYIVLKNGESKPVSNLKARYTIHLPASCAVDLKNSFGTITLRGLTNQLNLKADFCTTNLTGISGKGALQTTFGALSGNELAGTFTFTSDHTNVRLEQIAGAVRVDAEYGNVEIYPTVGLTSLGIHSKKAEVTLLAKNWKHFDYTINGAYATMKLPNGFKWKRNTADFKEAFFSRNQLASVDINAEFGRVTIK
ncbi:hypothetical protein [Dyadobacter fermentans]|uniref:Adhesin domain-containing protein n=1 Tax=Dyadobacter fermentans (strain ATCC 700827 / DSM 18053 / CIP 107007 / KCTC 52180 / NS114) TaxID=471854 RepID=C6W690_DYAFD|nr:hypothetical protein [Dyadobacter fermentans]ACT92570.1 hypothetical protein Dfer_1322 [Dyadobacter fermentans DSM 18053]